MLILDLLLVINHYAHKTVLTDTVDVSEFYKKKKLMIKRILASLHFTRLITFFIDIPCNNQSFILPSNFLKPGKMYIVTLFVTIDHGTKSSERKIYRKIQTNTPPTDGNCFVSQKTGRVNLNNMQ